MSEGAADTTSWIVKGPNDQESLGGAQDAFMSYLDHEDGTADEPIETQEKEVKKTTDTEYTKNTSTTETEDKPSLQEDAEKEEQPETTDATPESDVETGEDDGAEFQIPERFEELAQALGKDEQDLYQLRISTKVNGKPGEATLSDLVKSYQLEQSLTEKSMSLAEERRLAEHEIQSEKTALANKLQEAEGVLSYLEATINREDSEINWADLKENDRAEYSIKLQEREERKRGLELARHSYKQILENQSNEYQLKQQEMIQKARVSEFNHLLDRVPEWNDHQRRESEFNEITKFLKDTGFTQDEVENLIDHRSVIIARNAMLYAKMEQKKPAILKKARELPKVIKPGTSRTKQDIEADAHATKVKRLRKEGSVDAAADVFMDYLG